MYLLWLYKKRTGVIRLKYGDLNKWAPSPYKKKIIKLAKTAVQLRNTSFHTISDLECFQAIDDQMHFNHVIDQSNGTIKFIQESNTKFKSLPLFDASSTHPWAKDKQLSKLRTFRKRAKAYYQRSPNF